MRLHKVQIKNFKSIRDDEIKFSPSCRVLVGINESGKSNILCALNLLDESIKPVKQADLREALLDEKTIDESYVRFVFRFEKNESNELFNEVSNIILSKSANPNIVTVRGKMKKVRAVINDSKEEGLYCIDILEENKRFSNWKFGSSYKLIDGWKKPSASCPDDYTVKVNENVYSLKELGLIQLKDFPDIPPEHLEKATEKDLTSIIGRAIKDIAEIGLPDTLFWEYDEENLLPNFVVIDEFLNNPDSCIPLKNMFTLAGVENIKESIDEKRAGTPNQFQNFLDGVAKKTTNHFRRVWKENKNIEFSLRATEDRIVPGIKEKNIHDFERRSDGFKRFVTFLLFISVNVQTDKLQNTLLLIDEPDKGLHPSGSRYLRDELIKISKTNYVAYSTHSIFMIDSENIGRHYIVKKKDEITSVEEATTSNVVDEEVLFNALGHSVFAVLKEKNIVFEGWKDKHLFRIARDAASSSSIKTKFKEVGVCHAKGVKNIKTITPLIELARRDCLIVSDSDTTAKEHKAKFNREKGFGTWLTYQDIDSSLQAVTAEDFLKNDFIAKRINTVLKGHSMPTFTIEVLPDKTNKLDAIRVWLTKNGMTSEQAKYMLTQIKDDLFDNLKSQHIEEEYDKMLKGINP